MAKKQELPISDEKPKECSSCKQELSRHHWNTTVDILYCEDRTCEARHIPQGNINIAFTHHSMEWLNRDEKLSDVRRRHREPVPA